MQRRPWWIPILLVVLSVASLGGLGWQRNLVVSPTLLCGQDCICGFGGTHCVVQGPAHYRPSADLLLLCGILFALAVFFTMWLRNAKPVITAHADVCAGTLSVLVRDAAYAVTFAEKPVLVSRDGRYAVHTATRAPIALGARLSRKGLKALGALLADGRRDAA